MFRYKVGEKDGRIYCLDKKDKCVYFLDGGVWKYLCLSSGWEKFRPVMSWSVKVDEGMEKIKV